MARGFKLSELVRCAALQPSGDHARLDVLLDAVPDVVDMQRPLLAGRPCTRHLLFVSPLHCLLMLGRCAACVVTGATGLSGVPSGSPPDSRLYEHVMQGLQPIKAHRQAAAGYTLRDADFDMVGSPLPVRNETDIFAAIGLAYVPPFMRVF